MANTVKVVCKNVFKHADTDELKKMYTKKWIELIKHKNKEVVSAL